MATLYLTPERSPYDLPIRPPTPSITTSEGIEDELLGGAHSIIDPNAKPKKSTAGYLICVAYDDSNYKIFAVDEDNPNGCNITLLANGSLRRDPNKC